MDIVQIGYAGLEATCLTLDKKYDELSCHFSKGFLNSAKNTINKCIIDKEKLSPDIEFYQLSDPGIFGGLWVLAENLGIGIKIYLHDILVRQETIEILELFDANPYTYPSAGTYIAAVQNGHRIVKHLSGSGYPAAVIGHEIRSKDRIVINGDDMRFLTPVDRLYKDEQEINKNLSSLRRELSNEGENTELH